MMTSPAMSCKRRLRAHDMHDALGTVEQPLNALGEAELCPGAAALEKINASLR